MTELAAAIAAFRKGNRATARRLFYAALEKNPHDRVAWSWVCAVATSREEKTHCLEQILALNPADEDARRYLARLQPTPTKKKSTGSPICYLVSAAQILIVVLALALVVGVVYALPKSSLLGLRGPDFDSLTISNSFERIESDDFYWKITFEKSGDTQFAGLVRHSSPIRINRLRILTHDILVTSGEFADPDIVSTSVSNHHFRWRSESTPHPKGTINLLHTVPVNEEIYQQLRQIRPGDEVVISGREILVIKAYNLEGEFQGDWRDTGCNTLLVNSVTIMDKP